MSSSANAKEDAIINPYVNRPTLSTRAATLNTTNSAARLAYGWRKLKQLPVEILRDEFEGQLLEEYIIGLGAFCSSHSIPRYFDENLQSTKPDEIHCCVTTTLVGYIGQHLNFIRVSVYPDHPDFRGLRKDAYPEWYTDFRESFRRACNTFQLLHTGDEVFEGHRTQPLYRCIDNNKFGNYVFAKCDLKHIMLKIFKTAAKGNHKHEEAAWILTTHDAIGRPGEIKYDDYNDWYFDLLTELVDTSWKESKNLKKYTMPRVSDDFFGFDWYYVMGAFFMCEDGLFRSEEQIEQGKLNAVFVRLHQLQDASVAGKLAAAIQSNIPDNVLEEIRKLFTGKSLRKGAITELSMNSGLSIFNLSARSGHSLGVAMQDYVDQNNPAASFPAANALHGQRTLSAIPVLPDFNAVGSSNRNQWVALVKAAFVITIPDFMPGGRHSIILEVMMASMVRHFEKIKETCGRRCRFVSDLIKAAESIKLHDVQHPLLTPELVLVEWSKKLSQDYKERERKNKIEAMDPRGTQQNHLLVQMADDLKRLIESRND
jgi:hypothetical protein